ncbi:hypothetical protein MHBO_004034 [Bonamia ostreae]|uniref:Ribosomal protein S15 n=1 Tax=Bonamia ostreae TaxID=126728 RepID=A0ABV2AS73_9EUKA
MTENSKIIKRYKEKQNRINISFQYEELKNLLHLKKKDKIVILDETIKRITFMKQQKRVYAARRKNYIAKFKYFASLLREQNNENSLTCAQT